MCPRHWGRLATISPRASERGSCLPCDGEAKHRPHVRVHHRGEAPPISIPCSMTMVCSVPAILARARGPRYSKCVYAPKEQAQGMNPIAKDESRSALAPMYQASNLAHFKLRNVGLQSEPTARLVSESGRDAQAQSRTVRMQESMPGAGPRACLAPLPCTLFGNRHVVFRHTNLRCDRQVLKHRSMVTSGKGTRPLEEGARAARGGTRHVLGRSVLHCLRGACRSCWQRRYDSAKM